MSDGSVRRRYRSVGMWAVTGGIPSSRHAGLRL